MSINTKTLCTLLDQAETVVWSIKDGVSTISDRHVLVRFKGIPREVLSVLYSIFFRVPEEGKPLMAGEGEIKEVNIGTLPDITEATMTGKVTEYLKECSPWDRDEKLLARVIQLGDRYVLVQEKYVQLTTDRNVVGFKEDESLIFLGDGEISILPVRVFDGSVQIEMSEITEYFGQ
ncbi:hypothetical protein M5X04_14610 [Paenibacillus alvei]|uniref:Uncharacterized protein n=1 Tax=Paenibacillus alvei TaxID=44250 RepID=A0ABT4E9Y4_PAEAL|nr:hypothetical protein [Paenibacillus alvei]MCY9530551.1 hypothetical protein [Paenibacillus alvei]